MMSSVTPASSRDRVEIIDALRGLASLGVAWYHVALMYPMTAGSLLYWVGSKGWVGVEVFFVISGFVIPYSLARSDYRIRDFGRFMLKRIIRLDPPYLVSLGATISIAAWYWWRFGDPFPYSTPQLLLHLGYLNVLSKYTWISPIYWTLAVEVQFYLLVGLGFPLIMKKEIFWFAVAPICIASGFLIEHHGLVFPYLPVFVLGVAALHYRRRMIKFGAFAFLCVALSICIYVLDGRGPAGAAFLTAFSIGCVNSVPRLLVAFGSISYSLYLIHVPVSRLVEHNAGIPETASGQLELAIASLIASIGSAWLLYRLVELPSRRLSSHIRYSHSGVESERLPSAVPRR
jgi:peptidoglycan/LPS O-acetylase OafA/YrhL